MHDIEKKDREEQRGGGGGGSQQTRLQNYIMKYFS